MSDIRINLRPEDFSNEERTLVESGEFSARTFRFSSGVCALRLINKVGELVLLPFQGQQVWSATFNGRVLGMKTVCPEPLAQVPFLQTFGGFLQHCGVLAMGAPGPTDKHPLHGELPNAPFQKAWIRLGRGAKGDFIALGGEYRQSAVFGCNYAAEPEVRLYESNTLFDVSLQVTNLNNAPMELMYMAHINFRTVVDGRLVYSAPATPEHVRVRASIPTHITPKPGYAELLKELQSHPEKHHKLSKDFPADPEIVLCMDYLADSAGWAHSLQVHPNGEADYVAHRPSQLPRATRWISRTPDHDALALVEPGTAEPEGYSAEKKKGNVLVLEGKKKFACELTIGTVAAPRVQEIEQTIQKVLGKD